MLCPSLPNYTQGGGSQVGVSGQPDPNKSDIDKIERHYVPQLDINSAPPYQDPMEDETNPRNKWAVDYSSKLTEEQLKGIDAFIKNGCRPLY